MSYKPPSDFELVEGEQLEEDQQDLEMFLIQVPKKFDIAQLNGVKYIPGQIVDVATDYSLPGQLSAVYQLAENAMQDSDLKPLVSNEKETVVGQSITGHLSVSKAYSFESKPNINRPKRHLVPMPQGLKERFTSFGSGSPFSSHHHKHSKHRKHQIGSPGSSEDTSEKKKKKKKKRRDVDSSLNSQASPASFSQETADSIVSPIVKRELVAETPADETTPEPVKHKKKKKKEKKKEGEEEEGEMGLLSPALNGCLDAEDSSTPNEVKGILSSSAKRKHKKNVSFSHEDSFFMDSSGDAGRLSLPQQEVKEEKHFVRSQQVQDMNGDSDQPEMVKTGKKRKLSSGYSSADTSLEIDVSSADDSSRSGKKKKKKHKTKHE